MKVISSRVVANNANTVFVTPLDQNEFFDQSNIKTTSPITKTVSESIVYIGLDESKLPSDAKVFDSKSTFKLIHDACISGKPVYYKDDNALYVLSSFYDGAVYFSYVDSQIHTLKVDSNNNRTTTVSRDIVILEYGKNYGQLDALKQYAVNYSGFLLYQANVSNLHLDRFSGIVYSNGTFKIVSAVYSSDGTWRVSDADSFFRVKVNAISEPQYLFNAITEGNGICITGGDSDSMTIASKTMVLTWRVAYKMSKLLNQDVLEVDVEGERYHCIGKTDSLLTFARVDGSSIKTTTYDGEVWSDVKTVEVNSKQINVLTFNSSTGMDSFDPSLPTKVYVPDEGIFYDCTKYEERDGIKYFTITKDNHIFTTFSIGTESWNFAGMVWDKIKAYIDADPYEVSSVNFELNVLGQRVRIANAADAFEIELNVGGIVFKNCSSFSLIGHDESGTTFTAQLGEAFPSKLVIMNIKAIQDVIAEEIA